MNAADSRPALVTGASGFIGRRLVRRLIERRRRTFCLVRANSRVEELRAIGADLITGDVTDRGSVDRAMEQSRAGTVFHLAGLVRALPGGRGGMRDGFVRVNAGGVETVAGACARRADAPVLIVVSSLAAAGPCAGVGEARVESDVAAPVSEYGRSKLAGEQAAARQAAAVPTTIVRPPIVFGPGDRGVLEMIRPIARWGLHVAPGDGRGGGARDRRLSLVHVDDLVEGLLLAAEKGERLPGGEAGRGSQGEGVYFIAGEDHPTYAELGRAMAGALGRKCPRVVHAPAPALRLIGLMADLSARIRRRPSWLNSDKIAEALAGSWVCSPAKAHAQLGWFPAMGLGDRLRETVQWCRREGLL